MADYACQLGYTEKSLTRAEMSVMGVTTKTFMAVRIVLEARYLLVRTCASQTSPSRWISCDRMNLKHIEVWRARHPNETLQDETHWRVIPRCTVPMY